MTDEGGGRKPTRRSTSNDERKPGPGEGVLQYMCAFVSLILVSRRGKVSCPCLNQLFQVHLVLLLSYDFFHPTVHQQFSGWAFSHKVFMKLTLPFHEAFHYSCFLFPYQQLTCHKSTVHCFVSTVSCSNLAVYQLREAVLYSTSAVVMFHMNWLMFMPFISCFTLNVPDPHHLFVNLYPNICFTELIRCCLFHNSSLICQIHMLFPPSYQLFHIITSCILTWSILELEQK